MGGTPVIEAVRAGVQLAPDAAASFRRLEARLGRRADVNRTYADYNTQLRMYLAWQAWVTGRGPKPNHSRALHPDLSMHCRGLAWDSDDWRTPGFIPLAAEYGWIRTAAGDPSEQHHFEYQVWRDQHRNDPRPAGRSAAAPAPQIQSEEDEMLMLIVKAANIDHYCALGNGVFRHFIGADPREWIKNVSRSDDAWVEVTIDRLPSLLRTYGCDLQIWDVRGGQFVVLDPITGTVQAGNMWSAVNAARAGVEQVKVTSAETAKYIAELAS